ncbi:MAG TPA: carbon-nitrogen hydrolase family protein [bacterium]|nr:carbon-nitrogen hydrolase family protein [bacterium]
MTIDTTKSVLVAAVQMEGRVGDIDYNLQQVEHLATEAFESGARIVALPEFFTTPVVFDERLLQCSLPRENKATGLLQTLAGKYSGYIGGSLLLRRDSDIYNTYIFMQPDGTYATHDKDIPTMWENAFYVGGNDDGILSTDLGSAGAAVCWELIRERTVRRLKGKIDFIIAGSNWWTVPDWKYPRFLFDRMHSRNCDYAKSAPSVFAKSLGVPVIHGAHAGEFDGRLLLFPGVNKSLPFHSCMMGETQIVDNRGTILARRSWQDGKGVILAKITLQRTRPTVELNDEYWIPDLTLPFRFFWHQQRLCSQWYYRNAKKNNRLNVSGA